MLQCRVDSVCLPVSHFIQSQEKCLSFFGHVARADHRVMWRHSDRPVTGGDLVDAHERDRC